MVETYEVNVGELKRTLPIIPISDSQAIASFVLLGDAEMASYAANELAKKVQTPFDYIVTMESKGIPLAEEMSKVTNHRHYVVLRKSIKSYMKTPIVMTVNSITTDGQQELVLDGEDANQLRGRRVILLDDVISSGGSLAAAEALLAKANVTVVGKFAILAEGDANQRSDITVLGNLPIFSI